MLFLFHNDPFVGLKVESNAAFQKYDRRCTMRREYWTVAIYPSM